jgi:hypothetical protein
MALGGVDMFSRLGGAAFLQGQIRQTFLLFTRKTMHDFDAKKTHCRSRWLGSFLVWSGLVDQIWRAAMSSSCKEPKINFHVGVEAPGGEDGICR